MAEGCRLSRKKHRYMLFRSKRDLDCSQKRVPIKLKNRHGGAKILKNEIFSRILTWISGTPQDSFSITGAHIYYLSYRKRYFRLAIIFSIGESNH